MSNNDEAHLRAFFESFREQHRREEGEDNDVRKYLQQGKYPTDPEIKKIINSRVGNQRKNLLRCHVYWKENKLKSGFESFYHAAHRACIDICRHDAALGMLMKDQNFETHIEQNVGYAAQKDVAAYCFLVIGVRDTLRRIEKHRMDINDSISLLQKELFDHDLSIFIIDLRNNLSHGSVIVPKWQISYIEGNSYGSMRYERQELLEFGRWKPESKQYISRFGDAEINISHVVKDHFDLMSNLYRNLQDLFAINITDYEKDFFDIEDSHKKMIRRQWARILIEQMKEGKTPYDYLHKFFTPQEVREILRKPNHSKEQVDYIISLKSVEVDVDEELRHLLYSIFEIPSDSSTRS